MPIDPVIGTLSGVLGGAFIGFIGNMIVNIQKRKWDIQDEAKKRIVAKENEVQLDKKRTSELKFESYNRILKTAGEEIIISDGGGGLTMNFDFQAYSTKIRPLLFDKFHIIDEDVRAKIREIDYDLARTAFSEDATTEDRDMLARRYNLMISLIDSKYQSQ